MTFLMALFPMSLRVLIYRDAAISPRSSLPTSTRRLLRRCAPRNDIFNGAFFHVVASPDLSGRGNLSVLLFTNKYEEIASSLRSSQ